MAFGIASRVAKSAVNAAREAGVKAGLIRPITLWPYPKKALENAANHAKAFVCAELNMGQMREDVELAIRCTRPVFGCTRTGGMITTADEILAAIKKAEEVTL